MLSKYKRYLLSFIMLLLPLQAMASAAAFGCMLSHQGHTHKLVHSERIVADETMEDCHESSQIQIQSQAPDEENSPHECKHCSGCYLAASPMIPSLNTTSILPVRSLVITRDLTSFSGHIPDSPERPPRPHLA